MNDVISRKYANKVQIFKLALAALHGAVIFLNQDCNGQKIADRAECLDDLLHAELRTDLLASERPERVCVLVLGEFKAGKSTLINALVGQTVAATDTFEMTTTVCRIIPSGQAGSRVVLTSKYKERSDKTLTLKEFLEFSVAQADKLKLDKNAIIEGYTQARIYIQSELNVELVDTPGLGATLENEINASDAVSTCDVIIWTVDAQNIGGAREAAMLEHIHDNGQPLICVLTKSDALEADDVEPTIQYIADSYSVDPSVIFAVSAERHIEDRLDPGVNRLKNHLQSSVIAKGAMLRERALLAQASDIASEIISCLSLAEKGIDSAIRDAKETRDALLAMANNVTDRLCAEFASAVQHQLHADLEKHLTGDSNLDLEEEIRKSLERSMESLSTTCLFDNLNLEASYKHLWMDGIKSELQMLQTSLSEIRQEAVHKAADVARPVIDKQIATVYQKKQAIEQGLSAYGIFQGVTIVSGGHFLLGLIAAAPEAYRAFKSHRSGNTDRNEIELMQLKTAADDFFAEIASGLVEQQLKPELKNRNEQIVKSATDGVARNNKNWPLSFDELNELQTRLLDTKSVLEQI